MGSLTAQEQPRRVTWEEEGREAEGNRPGWMTTRREGEEDRACARARAGPEATNAQGQRHQHTHAQQTWRQADVRSEQF